MVEELPRKEATHSGVERTPTEEEVSVPAGYEDPHKAALEDDPEQARKLTLPVILSALFLGTSFSAPIVFGFILVTHILVQISQRVGGSDISFWIPSGWGAAAAVTFSVAGRLSDIFGRRGVILFGQLLCVVGGIVACTSHSMNQLIAGEVILGASIGIISAAYAGKGPFSWRYRPSALTLYARPLRDLTKQIQGHWPCMDGAQHCCVGCPCDALRKCRDIEC